MPIQLSSKLLDTVYVLPENQQITQQSIQAFAAATQNNQPACHNKEAALEMGYPNLVAPTTYNIILAQKADKELLKKIDINFSSTTVLHVEQKIVNHNPTFAEESLQVTAKITKIINRNSFVLLTTETDIKTVQNVAKSTLTSTIMLKENI